jgi:hypothetical protein
VTKGSNAKKNRYGYWLLQWEERPDDTGKLVKKPTHAVWVLGYKETPDSEPEFDVEDSWDEGVLSTQDASENEKSEFSAMGYRENVDAFNVSGRLEIGGDAALYGAPEALGGDYRFNANGFDLDMTWDAEQVMLNIGEADISKVRKTLHDSLDFEFANISGE